MINCEQCKKVHMTIDCNGLIINLFVLHGLGLWYKKLQVWISNQKQQSKSETAMVWAAFKNVVFCFSAFSLLLILHFGSCGILLFLPEKVASGKGSPLPVFSNLFIMPISLVFIVLLFIQYFGLLDLFPQFIPPSVYLSQIISSSTRTFC